MWWWPHSHSQSTSSSSFFFFCSSFCSTSWVMVVEWGGGGCEEEENGRHHHLDHLHHHPHHLLLLVHGSINIHSPSIQSSHTSHISVKKKKMRKVDGRRRWRRELQQWEEGWDVAHDIEVTVKVKRVWVNNPIIVPILPIHLTLSSSSSSSSFTWLRLNERELKINFCSWKERRGWRRERGGMINSQIPWKYGVNVVEIWTITKLQSDIRSHMDIKYEGEEEGW